MPEGRGSLASEMNGVVKFVIVAVFGIGIALFLGYTLFTALPSGSAGANAVNSLVTGTGSDVTTILVPVIAIVFVLLIYGVAKHYKLI